MPSKVFDSNEVIHNWLKTETKKNMFCYVIMYPTESIIHLEVAQIAKIDPDKLRDDNKIVIIPAKDMNEMRSLWQKFLDKNIAQDVLAYKNGKQFTF